MKWKKILLGIFLFVLVLVVAGITFTIGWRPIIGPKARPTTARTFERTPQRVDRGRYVANAITTCMDCHSPRDWTRHGAPLAGDKVGVGQVIPLTGFPGTAVAPNLTPDPQTGAGNWTDDQIGRAIREGIGHDGKGLFPLMPYQEYRFMSDEDVESVVVYLRSLPPVRNSLPPMQVKFPVNRLVLSVPQPLTEPVPSPNQADRLAYGKYLVTIAGCGECHTPTDDHGSPLPHMEFAGGSVFTGAWGSAASANITPGPSGIGYYDEALFIQALRTGYVKARPLNQIMPYGVFGNMTDDDLKAIFSYLRSVTPAKHIVDNTEPPTYCKYCRQKHGGGDKNI
jgi:mono/diheme cytochrome c family protein